jgi:putative acetyltransferase
MALKVRPQRPTDAQAVRDVITAAFDDDGHVADLAEALRARTDTQASLVAVDQGQIVGHTHLSVGWVDAPARLIQVLTLSPLAVVPSRQSRGVGKLLLVHAIAEAANLAAPLVFLEGDPAYYSRHGWRAAVDLGFSPPSQRIPLPAFQVITLDTYEPASMTGALVYNDTFWAFDSVGLRD